MDGAIPLGYFLENHRAFSSLAWLRWGYLPSFSTGTISSAR